VNIRLKDKQVLIIKKEKEKEKEKQVEFGLDLAFDWIVSAIVHG